MWFHGRLRRMLIALPFALMVVIAAILYQVFAGRFRPRPVCWADMERRHLRYAQFDQLFEVTCVAALEKMKRDQPAVYACGARCVVAAGSERDLARCPSQCPGFVDPLAIDDEKRLPASH